MSYLNVYTLIVSKKIFSGFLMAMLWVFSLSTFAQLNSSVYNDFNQTIVNPYLVNPAATDTGYQFHVRFNNITELGVFQNISRFYVDGDINIKSKGSGQHHFLGGQFINSKQGDFINRSRGQLRYSWYLPVSEKAVLASGVALGFVNYSFLTSQGGSGGADIGPDGAVGIHYLRENFALGIAMQQLFNTTLTPVQQSFRVRRVYNLDISRRFLLAPEWMVETQAVLQVPEEGKLLYGLAAFVHYQSLVVVGLSNFTLIKTSVNAGVQNISFVQAKFSLLGTYTLYHSVPGLADNTFEIFIGIKK